MAKRIKLDKVTHSVRASQAILQYGVGAMVDFSEQTLVTAAPETWIDPIRIYDDRFAKALGVEYFGLPRDISYSRFLSLSLVSSLRSRHRTPLRNDKRKFPRRQLNHGFHNDSFFGVPLVGNGHQEAAVDLQFIDIQFA